MSSRTSLAGGVCREPTERGVSGGARERHLRGRGLCPCGSLEGPGSQVHPATCHTAAGSPLDFLLLSLLSRRIILAAGIVLCSFCSAVRVTTSTHRSPDDYLIDLACFQLLIFFRQGCQGDSGAHCPQSLVSWEAAPTCWASQWERLPWCWTRRRFPEAWGGSYNALKPARLL